ncbi:hypothetical protein ACVGVM_09705 [Pseudonocardia bannensis]|uniref:DUF4913 domain-containing protein n=1 Tax=Pseudonocardia bannensis TaxID=630973 RepID=A0A848DGE3_9PSEU|nr:hypothetical protein [Pseudonocardia bannensis]NMH91646.1 hypothetical protein [Pseudonocardia bannensis]
MTDERDTVVTALARSLERSHRRLGELETLVRQLAADVTSLSRSRPAPGDALTGAGDDGREPAGGGWLLAEDREAALTGMADLVEWVEAVYLRYPDAELPSCWLWHPAVVEELWWLRGAHAAAYEDSAGSWQRIGDWHDRFRPGVVKRLRAAVGGCELVLHAPGGEQAGAPSLAPLADAAANVADAWTTRRLLPEPSDPQLAAAEQHDRAQHRKANR